MNGFVGVRFRSLVVSLEVYAVPAASFWLCVCGQGQWAAPYRARERTVTTFSDPNAYAVAVTRVSVAPLGMGLAPFLCVNTALHASLPHFLCSTLCLQTPSIWRPSIPSPGLSLRTASGRASNQIGLMSSLQVRLLPERCLFPPVCTVQE